MKVKTALISVSDKTGIVEFGKSLSDLGVKILSTGGTARALSDAGVDVTTIDQVTGFPEILNGRVKTLHPKVHGALLAVRDSDDHMKQLEDNGIDLIDIVVVNLYPFEKTIANEDVSIADAIENIDIGGPTMLRSAAKNNRYVGAITDPADYALVLDELKSDGELSDKTRQYLAAKVFRHTADYDSSIDTFLSDRFLDEKILRLKYTNGTELRYGENWHQKAMFFKEEGLAYPNLADAEQIWGKQLSYNNYIDMTGAIMSVKDLAPVPAVSVIKHTNPCGLATGKTISAALAAAWDGDRVSAFGSVIACTVPFDAEAAAFLKGKMVESVIAPDFTPEAIELLHKKKNIMLLKLDVAGIGKFDTPVVKQVLGGILTQDPDVDVWEKWETPTKLDFPPNQKSLAEFSMIACKNTKSNAIVLCEEYEEGYYHVLGMGAGQPNRVDSLKKLSATKAIDNLTNTFNETNPGGDRDEWIKSRMDKVVMASDAFFPFADTVRESAKIGIRYIIQPGGSVNDDEVIAAADELGVVMVFTGMRHFLH
ncbi:bifunctional phosphoribosylaminoimidazolecarboxamide formyltransferase/IMP cyclohydrolase [Candidatus Latescibacterota bacterium]